MDRDTLRKFREVNARILQLEGQAALIIEAHNDLIDKTVEVAGVLIETTATALEAATQSAVMANLITEEEQNQIIYGWQAEAAKLIPGLQATSPMEILDGKTD